MRKKKLDKTREKVELPEKQSGGKYQCPPVLKKLIEAANVISDMLKDGLKYEKNEVESDRDASNYSEYFQRTLLNEILKDQLETNPDITDEELLISMMDIAYPNWEKPFYELPDFLRSIADFCLHLRENNYHHATDRELITTDGRTIRLPAFRIQLSILKDLKEKELKGQVQTPISEVFHDVYIDRIRACKICNRIFWAENKNSETCSESCRNAKRQRTFRKQHKEVINAKRRENYKRKKKLEEIRSNRDGTLQTPEQ